jgi:hypothetical protein
VRVVLVLLVVLLAACKTAQLVDPRPQPLAGAGRADVTPLAVHRGLALEGFVTDAESPGRVRAYLQRPNWSMTVDVVYASEVEIHYVESHGLGFRTRGGVKYIHHTYNERAQRLADSIARESRRVLAEVDPDAYLDLPPPGEPAPPASEPAH